MRKVRDPGGVEIDPAIGTRVRHRRWMLGMSRESLADRTGIGISRLEKFEGGAHKVLAEELARMAQELEVSAACLFGSDDATDAAM